MNNNTQNQKSKNFKYAAKFICISAIVVVIVATVCLLYRKALLMSNHQSIVEQIAAIEAARAIPDPENAAIIYKQLLEEYDEDKFSLDFLDEEAEWITLRQPWHSKDYPELAKWLKERQETITKLLEATKLDKCRFPIPTESYVTDTDKPIIFRQWAYLLSRAANNDIGEGRTNDALEKHLCIMQLARHICQQPNLVEYMVGIAFEGVGLQGLRYFIVETDLAESQLKIIEEFPLQTRNDWTKDTAQMLQVERLLEKKRYPLIIRLLFSTSGMSVEDSFERTHNIYLRTISTRRAFKIIIAAKRYKDKHGNWPNTLDDVKSLVPAETFIDPVNNSSFAYGLSGKTFKFYSKGKNDIDENGQKNSIFDPNSNQLIRKEDDILFWPIPARKPENNLEYTHVEQQ